jgi:MtrB/PioB family decaheme-associated outer membrane protein
MLILLLLVWGMNAFAADGSTEGEIGAAGVVTDVNGSKAKFSEYSDETRGGGIYSDVKLSYDNDDYFLKFKATDIGYATQDYRLDGGIYGKFKYDLFYNEIIHNITEGAISPYSGIGSNVLTYPGASPSQNSATWNGFDYGIKRKQTGGDFRIDLLNPFYVDFSAQSEHRNGILPVGANTGMNSPGNFIELPAPIEYITNNVRGEIGYAAKPVFASLNIFYSDFTNDNPVLYYESIKSTQTDSTTLPPNNDYWRFGFKSSVQLSPNTRVNVNLSNARAESNFDLLTSYLLTGTTAVNLQQSPNSLSSSTFNGRKDIQNYSFVLTSNPVSFLDARVFATYYRTKNNSDQITAVDVNNTTTASAPGFLFTNDLFDYSRGTVGVDLGFRLPDRFYLDTAYHYTDLDRARSDIPGTNDDVYSAELRWSGLDFLMPKISYQRLQRGSTGPTAAALADNFGVDEWLRTFDAASQTADTYKVSVDFFPLDNLDLGIAYKYKNAKYPNTVLGMLNRKTNELDVYGGYAIGSFARVDAYFDLEDTNTYSFLRYFNSTSKDPNPYNPSYVNLNGVSGDTAYNWDMTLKDNTYEYGVDLELYLIPKKLTLKLQYDYVNSDGNDDLTIFSQAALTALNPAANNSNIDTPDYDDYKKSAFTFTFIYAISKSFIMTAGASFEEYKYSDVSLNDYQYVFGSGTSINYLSGAYANPSYNASVVFLTTAYKF